MASKKHVDPLKAKQKRQKIIAAVLGVLFIGVLAFQVPRVMKMMKTPPNPHANDSVTTTTATGTPSLAAPTLRGAEQPTTDPTIGAPVAVSATPTVQDGQLASFSRFASKDPFNQQLSDDKGSSPSSSSSSGAGSGSAGSGGGSSPSQIPTGSKPRPGSAVISVNGTLYTVATASDFPQANPLFHLVSVTAHSAKVSIAGGSYSSGAPTVTLTENKPVTLVNTADGTRYTLILKPLGTGVPGGSTSSSAGSRSAGNGTSSSSGGGSSGSGATTTTTPSSTTVTLPSPRVRGLRSDRRIERRGDARIGARQVGRVPDDDRHSSKLVAEARRVVVEVRVDAIRTVVRARRRIARVAGVRGDIRRAVRDRADERLRGRRAQHVLLVDGVVRVGRVGDRAVPLGGREDDVVVLDPAVDLHLLVGQGAGGGDPVGPGKRGVAGRERGDDGEDADIQHHHCHQELEHAEAALVSRPQVHTTAIGTPL